jgi:hypothetical protein
VVDLLPHDLPPLAAGAAFIRNLDPNSASIEPTAAVGEHTTLLSLSARTESHRQEQLFTGILLGHIWPTRSAADGMRAL